MIAKYLSTIIATLIALLLVCIAAIGFMLWRGHVMQSQQERITADLAAAKEALAQQKTAFENYRKQTDDMRSKLDAAAKQAATDQQHLQATLNHENNQTWGNARLPDAVASVLNQK